MADIPADRLYSKEDEWVRVAGNEAVVGITDYAQDLLSDIVYLELPEIGAAFDAGAVFGVVESVKAASDLYMPVAGTVIAINEALVDTPELINEDPHGEAWLVRVRLADGADTSGLMDAAAYGAYCDSRA